MPSFDIRHSLFNIDGFVKSPKTANFQFSHLIISIGYEIKILKRGYPLRGPKR